MILEKNDAVYAANVFNDYFANFDRIDDYLRKVKLERMSTYPTSLPGMGPEDDFLQDFTIHPNEMEIGVKECSQSEFDMYFNITSSHVSESSVPGKCVRWIVYDKVTKKILGFIRLGSPTINSKPRNDFLGKPLDTMNKDVMKRFNDSCIMGFSIVPVQPFGFNYLGGKLLAAICCSHLASETLEKKYGSKFCMFETTSLYGSTKSSSQYDGMKPFLRYKGLTVSNFAPLINDEKYRDLDAWFKEKNNGEHLIKRDASSRKLKTQQKMVSIIRSSLKQCDQGMHDKFVQTFVNAKGLTEQKRSYFCDYGYANVKEYMNLETDTLIKKENYDRYSFDGVVEWWKKKASTRYQSLQNDGRLRTELEVWNKNSNIDIIR